MQTHDNGHGMAATLLFAACLAVLISRCGGAHAQAPSGPSWEGVNPVLALARICRHEAGFPTLRGTSWDHGDDCPAIHAVITRVQRAMEASSARRGRPRTVPYAEAVHAYSRGRVFDRTRRDAACDVAWLEEDDAEPGCWRAGVPWARRSDAWLAILEHARAIHAGAIRHRCSSPPLHWGCGEVQTARGCGDAARAASAGWERISCGRTDNWFYRVPPSQAASATRVTSGQLAESSAR